MSAHFVYVNYNLSLRKSISTVRRGFACGFYLPRLRHPSAVRILGEAKDNSFSSSELARAGPIGARRNNSWMQEERESWRGERGEEWVGGGAIQIRNFPCGDSVAAGYPFPRNPGSSVLEWGRIVPQDSRRDPGRRARYIRYA